MEVGETVDDGLVVDTLLPEPGEIVSEDKREERVTCRTGGIGSV